MTGHAEARRGERRRGGDWERGKTTDYAKGTNGEERIGKRGEKLALWRHRSRMIE